jgi:hypothetical protein
LIERLTRVRFTNLDKVSKFHSGHPPMDATQIMSYLSVAP